MSDIRKQQERLADVKALLEKRVDNMLASTIRSFFIRSDDDNLVSAEKLANIYVALDRIYR